MHDFDDKIEEIHMGRLIQVLSHQMRRQKKDDDFEVYDDLSAMQKHVLGHILLESAHREIYQKDIEEEFEIRKSTVTGVLKPMEKKGYIRRESVERDARLKRLVPTKKAEALREELLAHVRHKEEVLLAGISREDILTCKKAICRMCCNLAIYNGEFKEADKKDE